MNLYYIESTQYNPFRNLAVEAAIAADIGPGDLWLYLWQNEKTIVIGRGQNALRECRGELLEKEGGSLARRTTGGGAVYHDTGNLCFTFAASPEVYDLQRQMKVVMAACASFGIRTKMSGRNDIITEEGLKFSGNAFSIKKNCKIQHGTLMLNVDREALQRYLTPSKLKLKAKGIASVRSRVCNLKDLCPQITVEAMKDALLKAFREEYETENHVREEYETENHVTEDHVQEDYVTEDHVQKEDMRSVRMVTVSELDPEVIRRYETQFSSWEWRYGSTLPCELIREHLFPWGEVEIHLQLEHMRVKDCAVYSDCLDTEYPKRMREVLLGVRYAPEALGSAFSAVLSKEKTLKEGIFKGQTGKMISDTLAWLSEEEQ